MQRIPRRIVRRAMSLALLGDYRRATGLLTDLLSRFPGCADLWADRGHIYEFRAACEYCDRRATRVQRDRLYTRAARDYRMALRVQPNHVRALVGLGDVVVGSRTHASGPMILATRTSQKPWSYGSSIGARRPQPVSHSTHVSASQRECPAGPPPDGSLTRRSSGRASDWLVWPSGPCGPPLNAALRCLRTRRTW